MKTRLKVFASILCFALLSLTIPTVYTGCKSSPNQIAFKTEQASKLTVTEAMGLWNVLVKSGKTTVDQERQVKAAFQKWQATQLAVCDAGKILAAYSTTNSAGITGAQSAFDQAIADLGQSKTDLFNLLTQFGVKLPI